jgi:hypothetical protein
MAKHKKRAKRVHVVFYRKVKGQKQRKRVEFWRKIGGKRRGTRAVIPVGGGKSVSMRVKLSDCVTLGGNMRCTVKPLGKKRKK